MVELTAKLGFDSKNDDYLKEILESIADFKVKWNILGKDKKQEWGVAHLLAEVRIHDGICFYQFPHTLRLKLHNPRVYAKLNLRLQNQFKSQYALVLWEVCFDYFDADRGKGETPFIPLEAYRELMGVEADEYTTFKSLNQWVIKPAIKEINDLTNYLVEAESKRLGRKISELKFRIIKVKQLPVQESLFPDIENLARRSLSNSSRRRSIGKLPFRLLLPSGISSPPKSCPNPALTPILWRTSPRRLRCRWMRQL